MGLGYFLFLVTVESLESAVYSTQQATNSGSTDWSHLITELTVLKVILAVGTDTSKFSVINNSFTGRVWNSGAPMWSVRMEALPRHLTVPQGEWLLTSSWQREKREAHGRSYRIFCDKPGNGKHHSAHNIENPVKGHLIDMKEGGQCNSCLGSPSWK